MQPFFHIDLTNFKKIGLCFHTALNNFHLLVGTTAFTTPV